MLKEFLEHLNWHAGADINSDRSFRGVSIYVWSGQGQKLSDIDAKWITNHETDNVNAAKAIQMWNLRKGIDGARAFDCSGLICYLMEVVGAVKKGYDTTANGLKNNCTSVPRANLKAGDFVFKCYGSGQAYHVGVFDGKGVIEARGRAFGVVKRPLNEGGWEWFGRPSYFKEEKPDTWTCSRNLKLTNPQMTGEDIKNLQTALRKRKYVIDKITGKFGIQTQKAVQAFQMDSKLTVDGIAGKNTITKLGGVWNG